MVLVMVLCSERTVSSNSFMANGLEVDAAQ